MIHPRASWLLGGGTGRDGGAPEKLEGGVYNENGHQEEGTDETRKGNDNRAVTRHLGGEGTVKGGGGGSRVWGGLGSWG